MCPFPLLLPTLSSPLTCLRDRYFTPPIPYLLFLFFITSTSKCSRPPAPAPLDNKPATPNVRELLQVPLSPHGGPRVLNAESTGYRPVSSLVRVQRSSGPPGSQAGSRAVQSSQVARSGRARDLRQFRDKHPYRLWLTVRTKGNPHVIHSE